MTGMEPYEAPTLYPRGWRVGPNEYRSELAGGECDGLPADFSATVGIDMDMAVGTGDALVPDMIYTPVYNFDMMTAVAEGAGLSADAGVSLAAAMDLADGSGGAALVPTMSVTVPIAQLTGVTYTQSSLYAYGDLTAANYSNMNNGSASGAGNATGTYNSATEYIRADTGSSRLIDHIVIGYDYLNNLPGGYGVSYTEGKAIQGSNNGSSWTGITTAPEYSGSPANGLRTVNINQTWRYIRLVNYSDRLALTEFQIWA